MIQQNNKNNIRDSKRFNDFLATNLDATIKDRYCQHCHLKLVHNPRNSPSEKYIYRCPKCNCGDINIHQTEPNEKIMVTFPTHNIQTATGKKLVVQSNKDLLPRSNYFINKRLQERNQITNEHDPYLQQFMKKSNNLTITSVEYYDPAEEE